MCPFGVTPFLCFDVVVCPTETLDDDAHKIMTKVEQQHLLEYRVIEDTMNRRSGTSAIGKEHFISLMAEFWNRRGTPSRTKRRGLCTEK
jgi:hypothetical protein